MRSARLSLAALLRQPEVVPNAVRVLVALAGSARARNQMIADAPNFELLLHQVRRGVEVVSECGRGRGGCVGERDQGGEVGSKPNQTGALITLRSYQSALNGRPVLGGGFYSWL